MKINFSEEEFKILLKSVAVAGQIYGIMGDMISEDFKKDSNNFDTMIHKLLGFSKEKELLQEFEEKRCFSDKYISSIADEVMQYEDYSFWELLARNMAKKMLWAELQGLDREVAMMKVFELEDKLQKDFEKNGLDNIKFMGKIED